MNEIQLSEAFKCLEDVDDKIFEDIKAPKLLKEGYVKRSEGKCLCSFDEENWEECSEEEFIELKDGGYEDLTESIPEVLPSENLSETLENSTAYMIRNDGKIFKCSSYHPYIVMKDDKEMFDRTKKKDFIIDELFYDPKHYEDLKWFYDNTLNENVKHRIRKIIATLIHFNYFDIDKLWDTIPDMSSYFDLDSKTSYSKNLDDVAYDINAVDDSVNQEFCRLRVSDMFLGGSSRDVYFRITSFGFNWFDIIWNIVLENNIDTVTIVKDFKEKDAEKIYKINNISIDHLPKKEFIELKGSPVVEKLNKNWLGEIQKIGKYKNLDEMFSRKTPVQLSSYVKWYKNSGMLDEDIDHILAPAADYKCETEKINESIKIDIRDDNQVSLAQKLINMKKELEADSPEEVVDLKASTDEEAQETSHEGQIKLTCKTCGTSIFLKQDEVEFDPKDPETVNKEFKECPYCHNSSGWEIEGKVVENEESKDEPKEDPELDSDLDKTADENSDDKPKLDKDKDELNADEESEDIDLSEDIEISKFNEKRFDNMINQYLNEVYDNIDSYRTTDGTVDDESNKILIEGIIKFKSGKETDTKFLFEAKNIDINGRIKFVGLNESFSKSKFAFSLQGAVINNQLFCTRLDYDYRPLITSLNESAKDSMIRVTGKIAYKRK